MQSLLLYIIKAPKYLYIIPSFHVDSIAQVLNVNKEGILSIDSCHGYCSHGNICHGDCCHGFKFSKYKHFSIIIKMLIMINVTLAIFSDGSSLNII